MYAQQFRYAKLAESPLIPLDLPPEPRHEDFTELMAELQTQNMEINEHVGRSANEMTAAYTIYRNDQEPVFQQLEQTGNALVTVPMPEKSRYYNVRMKEVRLYLKPITGSPAPNLIEPTATEGHRVVLLQQGWQALGLPAPQPPHVLLQVFLQQLQCRVLEMLKMATSSSPSAHTEHGTSLSRIHTHPPG